MRLAEQMANVGSEVERALRARAARNPGRLKPALARALELFDLTATDVRWEGHRRREILRAREEFCRLVLDDDASPRAAGFSKYFLAFAALARRQRDGAPAPAATE